MAHDSNLPTATPDRLAAGDTWEWKTSSDHYSAADGWTLTYYLSNAKANYSFAASADGSDHLVTVAAATTAAFLAGVYEWQSYATKAGERHRVGFGTIQVDPDLATVGSVDRRTHAAKVLDAIEALIEGRATSDQSAYTITTGGVTRSLSRMPIEQLITLRDRYREEVKREKTAERLAKGVGGGGRILTRFSR